MVFIKAVFLLSAVESAPPNRPSSSPAPMNFCTTLVRPTIPGIQLTTPEQRTPEHEKRALDRPSFTLRTEDESAITFRKNRTPSTKYKRHPECRARGPSRA